MAPIIAGGIDLRLPFGELAAPNQMSRLATVSPEAGTFYRKSEVQNAFTMN